MLPNDMYMSYNKDTSVFTGTCSTGLETVCKPVLLKLKSNNYPDLHHSQGVLKFATSLIPLLNF